MMIVKYKKIGDKISTSIGELTILKDGFNGGEGHGYLTKSTTGEKYFVKIMYTYDELLNKPSHLTPSLFHDQISKRIDAIIHERITNIDPNHFAAPVGKITEPNLLGTVCSFFENAITFEEWASQGGAYSDRIDFVAELACALGKLHARGMAHGDLNIENILIDPHNASNFRIIDFNNAYIPGAPLPLMSGRDLTMPAGLLDTKLPKESIRPTTDVFSFVMLAHAILLNRWDCDSMPSVQEGIALRVKGILPGDQARGGVNDRSEGFPFSILPSRLQHWFRLAYLPTPSSRPSMEDFSDIISDCLSYSCVHCHLPFIFTQGRGLTCPHCNNPLPSLKAKIQSKVFEINKNLYFGRENLVPSSMSDRISRAHFTLVPLPGAALLNVTGINGVEVFKSDGKKLRVQAKTYPILIEAKDVIRVLDVDLQII